MNAKEVRDLFRQAIEDAFNGQTRRSDQSFRPQLTPEDCDFIASIVYSTIGRNGLCVAEIVEDETP